jgi:hypothetical protein
VLKLGKIRPVLILIGIFMLTINLNLIPCYASSSIGYCKQFSHSVEIGEYGQFYINDILTFNNNGSSQALIPEITLTYPSQYYNRMFLDSVSDPSFQVSVSKKENVTIVKLTPVKDVLINPGVDYNLSISCVAQNLISPNTAQLYSVNLVLYPGVSLSTSKLISSLYIPAGASFINLEGYQKIDLTDRLLYYKNYNNTLAGTQRFQNLTLGIDPNSAIFLIDVPKAERTLQINDDGSILVSDTIQLKNLAKKNITSLVLALLNPNILNVEVVMPIGPEKSSDLGSSKQFFLDKEVKFNETYTFTIRYPAPAGMLKFVNEKYLGNITTSPPLNAIVNEYILKAVFSDGIEPKQSYTNTFTNAHQYSKTRFIIEYEPKLFWSATTIMPISLIVLIILLCAFALFQKEEGEEKKYSSEFFDVIQGKLQLVSLTVELYEERRTGRTVKQKFNMSKQEYLNRTSQMNSSLARIAGDFTKEKPEKKPQFEKVMRLNRDIDQALKAVIGEYDSLQAGKIGKDEFDKRRSESIRKLDSIRKEIGDEISTI